MAVVYRAIQSLLLTDVRPVAEMLSEKPVLALKVVGLAVSVVAVGGGGETGGAGVGTGGGDGECGGDDARADRTVITSVSA